MNEQSKGLDELLAEAIKLEMTGKDYYLEQAEKVESLLTKNIFRSLADDEERHLSKIKAIYHAVKTTGGWPQHEELVPREADIQQVFEQTMENSSPLSEKTSDYDALQHAAELEKQSILFYNNLRDGSQNEDEKQFLVMLIVEEEEHLRLITGTINYLFNTADFFSEEEKNIYE